MKNSGTRYLIKSKKFDEEVCKSWQADLIKQEGSLLIFKGVFDKEINHPDLGVIRRGTISYEYYWLDRWFNVFKFYEPDKIFRNFYCNINMLPKSENGVLEYVDLDIDIIVRVDFSTEILDVDEFEINANNYNYPDEIRRNVDIALTEIFQSIEARKFPFDSIKPPVSNESIL